MLTAHTNIKTLLAALFGLFIFLSPWQLHADAPKVLVTLKPLHSIVSALTLNITKPELLLDNRQSPHNFTIKPSDRRRLNQADFIIYASPDIESFMPAIQSSLSHQKIITLTDMAGIHLLTARTFDSHEHSHTRHHTDGHLWLSIDNAITISQHLSNEFIKQDADNTEKYRSNNKLLIAKLKQLKSDIQQQMQPLSKQPFLMFHDAFQYFEDDFNLTAGLFVTTTPEHKAGIRHIAALKQKVQQQNIHCIFYEPPHIPKIIQTISEDQQVRLIPLEPLGLKFQPGPEQYFSLLNNISNKLYNCLQQDL
jgi:zinc transport system substrate-binding protein